MEVKRWLETCTDILFKVRYAPGANFQSQTSEVVLDIGAFGTGALFIGDDPGRRIWYKSIPLSEAYISEDAYGRVDTLYRKFQYTARQAAQMFGTQNLSEAIVNCLQKDPDQKFWFLHCVEPNDEYDPRQMLHPVKSKAWRSAYIEMEERNTVDVGGYRTFPYAVARYETAPKEVYGRSPAMMVLPDIKMLNEMSKVTIRAGQMAVAPPIMLTDDASLSAFSMRSNSLNYGYLDANGRAMAQPFNNNARVDIGLDMMNQRREVINDAFLVTLFRILVQEPTITATEAMLRAQEKGQLLAPTMGRMQSELLGPMTIRELEILYTAGVLPPMPQSMMEAGGFAAMHIEYQGPLNQAQKAGVGVGIMQTFQALAALAQVDPSVMQRIDLDGAAQQLAEINGVPASLIRSDEELTQLKEAAAQQAQQQQLLNAAPVAANAARQIAQAQALVGSAPNQQAPNLGLPTGA
jgi:hypothetical protein